VLFLEWAATAAATKLEDGIDTLVFRDGLIRRQTVRATRQHELNLAEGSSAVVSRLSSQAGGYAGS
jgi:hypothetical protein